MLPIPFQNFIPKLFRENISVSGQAMVDLADDHVEEWRDDIFDLVNLKDPLRCPAALLFDLGDMVAADLFDIDSETTKRIKIANAISTHKRRSTWVFDAKVRIDAITGLDAEVYDPVGQDDWIITGDGNTPSAFYWGSLGADGTDYDLGISLFGAGDEIGLEGNIFIDCHVGINVSTLTAAQIAQIVNEIGLTCAPAYMRIYLGYIDVSGNLVVYAGGVID